MTDKLKKLGADLIKALKEEGYEQAAQRVDFTLMGELAVRKSEQGVKLQSGAISAAQIRARLAAQEHDKKKVITTVGASFLDLVKNDNTQEETMQQVVKEGIDAINEEPTDQELLEQYGGLKGVKEFLMSKDVRIAKNAGEEKALTMLRGYLDFS